MGVEFVVATSVRGRFPRESAFPVRGRVFLAATIGRTTSVRGWWNDRPSLNPDDLMAQHSAVSVGKPSLQMGHPQGHGRIRVSMW